MHKKSQTLAVLVGSLLLFAALFITRSTETLAVDCIGKPYGYPGCPLKSSLSSRAPFNSVLCGNYRIDSGEECDNGRLNGTTACSRTCTKQFCGDGILTPETGEECEPQVEEVYVLDPRTKQITTERQFIGSTCGSFCAAPVCDARGNCIGGCKRKFLPVCVASSSSKLSKAAIAPLPLDTISLDDLNEDDFMPLPVVQDVRVSSQAAKQASSTPRSSLAPALLASSSSAHLAAPEQSFSSAIPPASQVSSSPSASPITSTTPSAAPPFCGDGILQQGEQCDEGVRNSDNIPGSCRMNCSLPRCGDRVVDKGEECDDGNQLSNDGCSNSCQQPRCGDGLVQTGEQCDDGSRNADSRPNACRMDCVLPSCGDSIVDKGEECDDGNQIGNDSCSTSCQLPRCGDSIIQTGEQCDDGTRNADNRPNACRMSCIAPRCGDAIVDNGEQCDDGYRNSNERPNACRTDCTLPHCGNSIIDPGEECDDGNTSGSDSCTNDCRRPFCGDGIVQVEELCDDGARNSDTKPGACRVDCMPSRCGDKVIDKDEECDGGTQCSQACKIVKVPYLWGGVEQLAFFIIVLVFAAAALGAFLYQRLIMRSFHAAPTSKKFASIDDIPLDQIEFLGRKWQ